MITSRTNVQKKSTELPTAPDKAAQSREKAVVQPDETIKKVLTRSGFEFPEHYSRAQADSVTELMTTINPDLNPALIHPNDTLNLPTQGEFDNALSRPGDTQATSIVDKVDKVEKPITGSSIHNSGTGLNLSGEGNIAYTAVQKQERTPARTHGEQTLQEIVESKELVKQGRLWDALQRTDPDTEAHEKLTKALQYQDKTRALEGTYVRELLTDGKYQDAYDHVQSLPPNIRNSRQVLGQFLDVTSRKKDAESYFNQAIQQLNKDLERPLDSPDRTDLNRALNRTLERDGLSVEQRSLVNQTQNRLIVREVNELYEQATGGREVDLEKLSEAQMALQSLSDPQQRREWSSKIQRAVPRSAEEIANDLKVIEEGRIGDALEIYPPGTEIHKKLTNALEAQESTRNIDGKRLGKLLDQGKFKDAYRFVEERPWHRLYSEQVLGQLLDRASNEKEAATVVDQAVELLNAGLNVRELDSPDRRALITTLDDMLARGDLDPTRSERVSEVRDRLVVREMQKLYGDATRRSRLDGRIDTQKLDEAESFLENYKPKNPESYTRGDFTGYMEWKSAIEGARVFHGD